MRDNDGRTLPLAQIALQPLDRGNVQVVGGFVQQEQVRIREQQASQERSCSLATGKMFKGQVKIACGKAQAIQDLFNTGRIDVAAPAFKILLQGTVAEHGRRAPLGVGHFRLKPLQFQLQALELRKTFQADPPQGTLHLELSFLGQIADPQGFGACHSASRRLLDTHQNPQQSGLADAVRPYDRQARPARDSKVQSGEEVHRAEGFGKIGGRDQRHSTIFC